MKKIALVVVLLTTIAFSFGQDFSFSISLNGNAHIVSWETMSRLHEMKKDGRLLPVSADGLYRYFEDMRKSSGGNELLYNQRREE